MLTKQQAVDDMTRDKNFRDLSKFQFDENEWALLKDYEEILQVLQFECSYI